MSDPFSFVRLILAFASASVLAACGSDGSSTNDGSAGTPGNAGSPGTGGTAGSAGTGGTSAGGSAGTAGSAGAGGLGGLGGTGGMGGTEMLAPAPDYSDEASWICLPGGADDVCDENLDASIFNADGTVVPEPHVRPANPTSDCFYVYPTITEDTTLNSDLVLGNEVGVTRIQAARMTRACRVFAPVYRQASIGGFAGPPYPSSGKTPFEIAYDDVLAAWSYYLQNHNQGRPVLLFGHSQGAGHLTQLIAEEIDGDAAKRALIVSAMLIGVPVLVPDGQDVGGVFQNMPLCRAATETGCIVNYSVFRDRAPPPTGSIFGTDVDGVNRAACNHPGQLAGGPAPLNPYFSKGGFGNLSMMAQANIATEYVTMPGLLQGECVRLNEFDYLELRVNADPSDPRPDDITGDLTPAFGLHLVDMHVAMGDLVTLAESQIAAFVP